MGRAYTVVLGEGNTWAIKPGIGRYNIIGKRYSG